MWGKCPCQGWWGSDPPTQCLLLRACRGRTASAEEWGRRQCSGQLELHPPTWGRHQREDWRLYWWVSFWMSITLCNLRLWIVCPIVCWFLLIYFFFDIVALINRKSILFYFLTKSFAKEKLWTFTVWFWYFLAVWIWNTVSKIKWQDNNSTSIVKAVLSLKEQASLIYDLLNKRRVQ